MNREQHNDPDIRSILDLRDRGFRDRAGLYFCEGARFLIQAAERRRIERAIATPEVLRGGPVARALGALRRDGIPVATVEAETFRAVSRALEPTGVGIIARQHWDTLPSPHNLRTGCWVAFDHVQSPGNLGTVLRTCDAVGASGVIATGPAVDPYDPGAVRASMGSVFSQRIIRCSWREMKEWAAAGRVLIVGTSPRAERDYREVSYRRPVVLAMGCEREGLSTEHLAMCDVAVRIPMVGTADSLNLAVASSVMLYEVYRQKHPARRLGTRTTSR